MAILKVKIRLIQLLVLGMMGYTQFAVAEIGFPLTKKFQVADLITKQALQCSNYEGDINSVQEFYSGFSRTNNSFPTLNGKPYQFDGYTIAGINAVSSSKIVDNDGTTTSRNMDINIDKLGVNILRISSFGYRPKYYSEGEGGGYYFVLKGSPTYNKKILQAKGLKTDNIKFEMTPAKNTRLSCWLAG